MLKKSLLILLSLFLISGLVACEKKGPTQRLGEKVDTATEKVQDAVDPKGPVEKAGRTADKALGTNNN